ncbi:MAG TPA: ribonuclease III [Candidatus Paceibacterota bacterium]|nr:ribonuclease III [Candidatus Paceibacterota bacterium]
MENPDEHLGIFERKINVTFHNKNLLRQAFTHRSFINEHRESPLANNERLEFLGDAVLELAASDFLYKKYPDAMEGELTSYRAGLVNTNSLSETAAELGMNSYLLLSKGEARDEEGRARQYILADTFEAVTGAMYLDRGYQVAEDFLHRILFPKIDRIVEKRLWQDAKSLFQERVQEIYNVTPSYEVLHESGPDHDKTFTAGAFIGDELVSQADGPSKQEAEQNAAEKALQKKGWR